MLKENRVKIIDRLIFGFVLIFLVSLTNSIFINQVGYFGALLLIIARYFIAKEKINFRTGLELPFILFLSAEFISALFSIDQAQALRNFVKRLLLVPVVYTIFISTDDFDKAKLYFKYFIAAAVLTIAIYLIYAYRHYISQLYTLESRGPSPFQYVMTAGGLMSFIVVILFAFILNEKTSYKIKLLTLFAFIISSVALLSSYTRAAWLGAFAGIITVLIIKRKWVVTVLIMVVPLILLFTAENESLIRVYDIKSCEMFSFTSNGRAKSILAEDSVIYVADYEKGISMYDNEGKSSHAISTPSPAVKIDKWGDNYFLLFLIDTRILIAKEDTDAGLIVTDTFITPGLTRKISVFNNYLYTADEDSGLTIYKDPDHLADHIRLSNFEGIRDFDVDSSFFTYYDYKRGSLKVYACNNFVPSKLIDSLRVQTSIAKLWCYDDNIILQTDKSLNLYKIENDRLVPGDKKNILGLLKTVKVGNKLFSASADGKFYRTDYSRGKIGSFDNIHSIGKNTTDFYVSNDKIYFTTLQMSRITSIIDPYHDTNLERLAQWRTGYKILKDYPFFGIGDIDLSNIYSEYKDYYLKENFGHLHNNYIHFLVILGIIGFMIVVYLLTKILLMHLRIYRLVKNEPFTSSFALGAAASFVGFLVSGLAEWNFGDQEIITMIWFILGLNLAFYRLHRVKTNYSVRVKS